MFSTDNKSPSWFRVMFTPAVLAGSFAIVWGALKGMGDICLAGSGVLAAIGGFKALQKKSEV